MARQERRVLVGYGDRSDPFGDHMSVEPGADTFARLVAGRCDEEPSTRQGPGTDSNGAMAMPGMISHTTESADAATVITMRTRMSVNPRYARSHSADGRGWRQ